LLDKIDGGLAVSINSIRSTTIAVENRQPSAVNARGAGFGAWENDGEAMLDGLA
jgi:hypothetical protein